MNFEPEIKKLPTTKTARYFLSAPITEKTKQVWIVLHGYGMHAGIFLHKFKPLFCDEIIFIAPEALNRFYVKGTSGNVGASWMTKEERLDEINDYIGYLDNLTMDLNLSQNITLNVLGFSQGSSTLARWISSTKYTFNQIVFYAGVFPPDLELSFEESVWKNVKIHVLIGNKDEYYEKDKFQNTFKPLEFINPGINFVEFDGKHEIIPELLRIYCK